MNVTYLRLSEKGKILDIGCARAFSMISLGKLGHEVFGIEIIYSILLEAKKNLTKLGIHGYLINSSAVTVPFTNSSFDCVICTEVLEHVPDVAVTLSEINRVLKPNGIFCVSVPTWYTEKMFNSLDKNFSTFSGHLRIFGRGELESELYNFGFEMYHQEGEYFEYSVYWLIRTIFFKTDPVFYEEAQKCEKFDRVYKLLWRIADKLLVGKLLKLLGNSIFPKSNYFYCKKVFSMSALNT